MHGRQIIPDPAIEAIFKMGNRLLSDDSSASSDESVSGAEDEGVDNIREVGRERRALPSIEEESIQAMPGTSNKNGVRLLDARFLQ